MLKRRSQYVCQNIEKIIKQIQHEDSRFDFELRSCHREKVILPVDVRFMNGNDVVQCYSRNLSGTGICLLSEKPFNADTQCVLQVNRLDDSVSDIVAVNRWCKSFGPKHWISGWQFIRISKEKRRSEF